MVVGSVLGVLPGGVWNGSGVGSGRRAGVEFEECWGERWGIYGVGGGERGWVGVGVSGGERAWGSAGGGGAVRELGNLTLDWSAADAFIAHDRRSLALRGLRVSAKSVAMPARRAGRVFTRGHIESLGLGGSGKEGEGGRCARGGERARERGGKGVPRVRENHT